MKHVEFCMWIDQECERLHSAGMGDIQQQLIDVAEKAWAYVVGYDEDWSGDFVGVIDNYVYTLMTHGKCDHISQIVPSELVSWWRMSTDQ